MKDRSPRCYIPSFVEIGPPVPERIFEGFFHIGHGDHLGHVTSIIFISMYLKAYIQNFIKNGPVVSVKSQFNFHM